MSSGSDEDLPAWWTEEQKRLWLEGDELDIEDRDDAFFGPKPPNHRTVTRPLEASYAPPDNSWGQVPAVLQYASTHGNPLELYPSSSSTSEADPSSPGTIESALSYLQVNPLPPFLEFEEIPPGWSEAGAESSRRYSRRTTVLSATSRAKNFVLNIVPQDQMAHSPIVFHIDATPFQTLYDVGHFQIQVQGPSQACPMVTVAEDRPKKRFICSFRSAELGDHFISVRLAKKAREFDASNHIQNSPNFVTVKLDCMDHPTVMTRIFTAGRINQDAPGLTISATSKIWGVTNDPEQELIYAADRGGHEVLIFSMHTGQIALAAKFAAPVPADGRPFRPAGIHFCGVSQLLYVTDQDNHRVCIFETGGNLLSSFGTLGHQEGQLKYPWGVAVSPDGELVAVADSKNHRLQIFSKNGQFLKKYSVFQGNPYDYKNPTTGLDIPRGVCFNEEGNLIFMTDFNLHNVISVDVGTLKERKTLCPPHRLIRPQGIAMDPAGNLLVCDSRGIGGGGIRVIRPDPGENLVATVEGSSDKSRFQMPVDVTVCRGGKLCVVDCGGSRLQIFGRPE